MLKNSKDDKSSLELIVYLRNSVYFCRTSRLELVQFLAILISSMQGQDA